MRRTTGDDDTLIRAAARGDENAFAQLMRRHRAWVMRLLRAFTRDADAAEDLTQEVFARLHRRAGGYHGRGAFVPYLQTIAANVGRTHLRRDSRWPLVSWDETGNETTVTIGGGVTPPDANPLRQLLRRALQTEIHSALAALPTDQREAVILRYFDGLTVPEIADALGCPTGTVKSRLFHALRKIRAALHTADGDGARA